MRKKWIKIICMVAAMSILTGCWDARDIEERDIVTFVVVDKTQDGFSFLIEYAKPSPGGTEGLSPQFAYGYAQGATFVEAREALDRKTDYPLYLGATSAVVFTDKLANTSIEEYIYRLRELNDYRKTVNILITSESPESFSEVQSEKFGAGAIIASTMHSLVLTGQMFEYNLSDILNSLAGPCKCFLLPNIAISEQDIAISGYSVFDSAKCIGSIPTEKSKGIMLLKADNPKMFYTVPYQNGQATIKIKMRRKELKPSYSEGKIGFCISFSFDAELKNTSNSMSVTVEESKQIRENLQMTILKDIEDAIKTSLQEFQCDYYEFFNSFRIAYPVAFRNMDWHQEYPKSEFVIQVTADLDTTGRLDYVPRNEP